MPRYNYECIVCGDIRIDVTMSTWREVAGHIEMCDCGGEMRKMPAAPNFSIGGKYTAKNGYSNETK